MSKIHSLQIQNIRSFGKKRDKSDSIKFFSPLTLIVGENGSGKTTIIECLKYAAVGEQPPNSKGGAFIHDPLLVSEKTVMAQVKLLFTSVSKATMIVTRSLQLDVKKNTRAMKQLDATLKMHKNNETLTISSKMAELNEIVPEYFGVSKAILDNVIFCHQDESLWPLREPSELKKRFDEIFEAQKYTKAIDNIKLLRKQQNEELGKYKLSETHAKSNKIKADRMEQESKELWAEVEKLREQLPALDEQMNVAQQKASEAYDRASQYREVTVELEGKRKEAQMKEDNVANLKQHTKMMQDSDEELQAMVAQYEERENMYKTELDSKTHQWREIEQSKIQRQHDQGSKQSDVGRLDAEKNRFDHQIQTRDALVKETARHHNVRGFDHELNDRQVADFMERIAKMARDQNAAFERARRETQQEMQEAQVALNKLNERKVALNQTKESAKSQIAAYDKKLSNYQHELNKIDFDEGSKATVESEVKDLDDRLGKLKAEQSSANWDQSVLESETQLKSLEAQKELLEAERDKAMEETGERAQVDNLRKMLKDSQNSLETLRGVHGSKIEQVVGSNWQPATLETTFQRVLESKLAQVRDAEAQRDGTQRELEQLEFKLESARNDRSKKLKFVQQCEKHVRDAIDGEEPSEYPDTLKTLEANRDTLKQDVDSFSVRKEYFSQCFDTLKNNDVCRLCERAFKTDKERSRLTVKLEKFLSNQVEEVAAELAAAEKDLKAIREAGVSYDSWLRLSNTEIPQLDTEIKRLESTRQSLVTRIEEKDQLVNDRTGDQRDVESITKAVQNLSKYGNDVSRYEAQIHELSVKHSQAAGSRGFEEIRNQLKDVNEQYRSVQKARDTTSSSRDRVRNQISTLEIKLRDANSKLSAATFQLKERDAILRQIDELKEASQQQKDATSAADTEMQQLIPQISQNQAKLDDIQGRGDVKMREIQDDLSRLNNSINKLKSAESDINAYLDRNGHEQLARAQRELEKITEELSHISGEQQQLTRDINKIKDQQSNHENTRRTIVDNLRYRQELRGLGTIQEEIAKLEGKNADKDRERWTKEGGKWSNEHARLRTERDKIIGEATSKDVEIQKLAKNWHDEYKDAAQEYKEAHIRVETTAAAVEDLKRYGDALDGAIMKYHSLKMAEVNDIISELWRRTYRGTDVDSILIRSEGGSTNSRNSYNYRVCMRKQDVEMDMRGRCSAGQRVLACIIIRLALAECFGVNCGLIALDEPTTNLDRENIQSLAESLHAIIRQRESQENFQLIVITHDTEFLRYMQCADFCDSFWKISRDAAQKSQIDRLSIAEIDLS